MYTFRTQIRTLAGDLHTPVTTYLKLRDLFPQSALMESADRQDPEGGRSFIGLCPIASFAVEHGKVVTRLPGGVRTEELLPDGHEGMACALRNFLALFRVEGEGNRYCGLYGYTSFNAVRYLEDIPVKDSRDARNDAPDALYILYRYLIVFNDVGHEMRIVEMLPEGEESGMDKVVKAVMNRNFPLYPFSPTGEVTSTLTDDEHRANIRRAIGHCLRGDVFQVVLSRRFEQPYSGDDFQVYRALRGINPSPYLFYFDFGGFRIFGSSPETHCRVEGRRASIDPIAGTTRRTGIRQEDEEAIRRLLDDPKENAEHVMLVDLARNDLARNCTDVRVDYLRRPRMYSHVIHLTSRVSGTLRPEADAVKVLLDSFPAGTLSGAPKVRAMQLISEVEPHNRGAYGGCIGFIGLDGSLNQAITIRTFVSRNGILWFQAGGGIVAKSDVEAELQEVNNKLAALRKAIELAEVVL